MVELFKTMVLMIREGDWMVVVDESDGTLEIPSTISIITNLDPEHLDHYGSFAALKKTFIKFINNIPLLGWLFVLLTILK